MKRLLLFSFLLAATLQTGRGQLGLYFDGMAATYFPNDTATVFLKTRQYALAGKALHLKIEFDSINWAFVDMKNCLPSDVAATLEPASRAAIWFKSGSGFPILEGDSLLQIRFRAMACSAAGPAVWLAAEPRDFLNSQSQHLSIDSDTASLAISPNGAAALGPDTAFCEGSLFSVNLPTCTGCSAVWENQSTDPIRFVQPPAVIAVQVNFGPGRSVSDSLKLETVPAPLVHLTMDTAICKPPLTIGPPCADCRWLFGSDTLQTVELDTSGQFLLVAVNASGCQTPAFLRLTVSDFLVKLPADTTLCLGDSLALQPDCPGCESWNWSTGTVKTGPIQVHQAGFFIVEARDSIGCVAADSMEVFENTPGPSGDCGLWLPDFLSPNGDQQNDALFLGDLPGRFPNRLLVFDRWGQPVFSASDYKNDWPGVDETGRLLPDGVYFYTIVLRVGNDELLFSSSLLIVR